MHGTGTGHRIRVTFVRSLRARALVVILVPAVMVLADLGAATWFDHVDHRASDAVQQTRQTAVAAASAQAAMVGAEADADTYVVDGSAVARQRFEATVSALPRMVRDLSTGTTGRLRVDVGRAAAAMDQLSRAMAPLVTTPPPGPVAAQLATVAAADTRLTGAMAAVHRDVAAHITQEQATISSSDTDLVVVGSLAAAVTLLAGVGLSLLFADRLVRRLRLLADATAALAAGSPPGPLPTGSDEIGRLGRQLDDTGHLLHQDESAREQARANFDAIMGASPVVSLRYDTARRAVVYASPNISSLFGVSVDEVLADTAALTARLHPDDVAWLAQEMRAVLSSSALARQPTEHHIRFRRTDGAWREALMTLTAIDDSGTADAAAPGRADRRNIVVYVVDVTERLRTERAADERRHLLESIFDASPDLIVVRDEHDHVVLASGQVSALIGPQVVDATVAHRPPGTSGEPASASDPDAERNRRDLARLARRCRQGDTTAEPLIIRAAGTDGVVRVFETRARRVVADDGQVTGTVTVSRDITDRVQLEESLRRASASAEAASTAKSEFLSRMSHELRTPLNAVLGFAQLLELDDLAPEQAEMVDQIRRAGHHLLSLINEILDISRIESGHLSLSVEPVAVDALMAEVAALLGPVAEPNRVQLQLAVEATNDMHVLGDRQRLLQVLLNLGSNAVKYNRPDGLAVFHTTLEPDGWVRFAVTDTGPGIPPERRAELFVPFSRLGAERSDVEGTGVGLALSKHLVELMGGTIGVTSEPGRGSTFWVELRRTEPATAGDDGFGPDDVERHAVDDFDGSERHGVGGFDGDHLHGVGVEHVGVNRDSPDGEGADGADQVPAAGPAPGRRAAGAPWGFRFGSSDPASPAAGHAGGTSAGRRGAAPNGGGLAADRDELPLVVLHVEDNESNAALVAQVLSRRSGVSLLYAGQARIGLELASRHRPDLILLDLHLPDLPGDEFLHRLRADPAIAATRVVAVSADATPARIRRMLSLGVEAYLTKPIDVPSLLRLVDLVRLGRPVSPDPTPQPSPPPRPGTAGTRIGPWAAANTENAGPMP